MSWRRGCLKIWYSPAETETDPSDEDLKKDIDVDKADQKFTMLPGEVRRLELNKTGKSLYSVGYTSSDPKVVSVKNGVVTAKKAGSATVTAFYCGTDVPFTITVDGSTPSITPGDKGSKISATKTVNAVVGTGKTVSVKLPKTLQGKTVTPDKTEYGCFTLGAAQPDVKGTKVSFAVTPREAGASYIVWTVKDDSGKPVSQAVTKVVVKEPLGLLSVNGAEAGLNLTVGEGKRIIVTTTMGNTDTKDVSFSVRGKGVKVSKSGYVVATIPNADATVTGKASIKGMTIDPSTGKVTITSDASPGCYTVTATATGYNVAFSEIILK